MLEKRLPRSARMRRARCAIAVYSDTFRKRCQKAIAGQWPSLSTTSVASYILYVAATPLPVDSGLRIWSELRLEHVWMVLRATGSCVTNGSPVQPRAPGPFVLSRTPSHAAVARARQRASPTGPGGVASSPLAPRTRTVTVTVAHHRQRRLRKPGLRMGRPPKTVKSLSRSGPGPLRWFKVAFRVQLLRHQPTRTRSGSCRSNWTRSGCACQATQICAQERICHCRQPHSRADVATPGPGTRSAGQRITQRSSYAPTTPAPPP